ncbi:MAG: hypothetical protein U0232_01545 [Thermomicrobiales bacterium]
MPADDASPHSPHDAAVTAEAIHSAAIHLLRRLRREDDASGLTRPRLSALSVVVFGGPIALGTLAAVEQVRPHDDPPRRRAGSRWPRRAQPDPRDGRSILIRATDAGRHLLEAGRTRRTSALVRQFSSSRPRNWQRCPKRRRSSNASLGRSRSNARCWGGENYDSVRFARLRM